MRVPLGWLSEFIDLPEDPETLAERLTLAGLELDEILRTGPELEGVRVGRVVAHERHPNADRLSLCRVDLGEGEPVDIVCGAPNVAPGQKVAVVSPGTRLPDGTKVKKTKIRGVVSHGMICSLRELGLGDEHSGILVLDADAEIGTPLASQMGGETVLDLELTPNRGDCTSLLGVAREVRAHFGGTLRLPPCEPNEVEREASDDIRISIEDPAGCYCYAGRVVLGVKLGPSPDWLRERLEACGQRSLGIAVDVTNLILLEFGQPLHAFDLASIRGAEIRVRAARVDERIVTLDGQTRELSTEDLVIADAERPVAIAGVMGGVETEVGETTVDILLESAHFAPSRVRRTARRLNLHSEASYRFERGIDPEGVVRAVDRAARLLSELSGGAVSRGVVEARGDPAPVPGPIRLDPKLPEQLLGVPLQTEEVVAMLGRVGVRTELAPDGRLECVAPSWRNDLGIPEDLVEEVGRVLGYDQIEPTMPIGAAVPATEPAAYRLADRVRDLLVGSGLSEMRAFPAVSDSDLDAMRLAEDDPRRRSVRLLNPIVEEEPCLRSDLVPTLLRAVHRNLSHQLDRVRLFEVSRVFRTCEGRQLPEERLRAAAVLTRGARQNLWEAAEPAPLFFEAKGIVEGLLREFRVEARFRSGTEQPYLHPAAAGEFVAGKDVLATVGELHPEVAAHFEIEDACGVLELDLDALETAEAGAARSKFVEVSKFPAVRRDLAILVDEARGAGEVLEAMCKGGGSTLVSVTLFDRYQGKGIPDGKVSLAFRLIFQRPDRTLRDAEVAGTTDRIVKMLAHRFGGELR